MATFEVGQLNGTFNKRESIIGTAREDLYGFTLLQPSDISASLGGLSSGLDVSLYQDVDNNGEIERGEFITTAFGSSSRDASLEAVLEAGTYFVRVSGFRGDDTRYDLTLSGTPTGRATPGNTSQTAVNFGSLNRSVTFSDYIGGGPTAEDFYRFDLAQPSDISASLSGLSSGLDVSLYQDVDNNGEIDHGEFITTAFGSSSRDASLEAVLEAGTYFVRVSGFRGDDTRYDLTLSGPSTGRETPDNTFARIIRNDKSGSNSTPVPASRILSDSNLLNVFDAASVFAAIGATLGQFFDLSEEGERIAIRPNLASGGVRAFGGNDTVTGSSDDDVVNGNRGADVLNGAFGDDYLRGGKDNDRVFGDEGNDLLNGNRGNDIVDGGIGNDYIRGGQDNDVLIGGDGNDVLSGDFGFDRLTGGSGDDVFVCRVDTAGTDVNQADRITDFEAGDQIAIAGDITLIELNFINASGHAVIQHNNGDFMAVVLNTLAATVERALFTVSNADSALGIG